MKVKRIYGALNVEFEDGHYTNFAILDKECDRCMDGGCEWCEEAGKPWNEYYQLLKYDMHGDNRTTYERDQTEAIRGLVRMLQGYLEAKGEEEECTDTAK